VDSGREHLNFSEWGGGGGEEADELAQVVREGEMPPWMYPLTHPVAKLSDQDRSLLAAGLEKIQPAGESSDSAGESSDDD
jgi:hypothetical protein